MQLMSLDDLMSLNSVMSISDIPYILTPNTVDLCISTLIAPRAQNPTAFFMPFMPNGDLVLADNVKRGPEVCGGHIEPGETAIEAALREAQEEAGVAQVKWWTAIGLFRSITKAEKPENYRYPHPVSVQQFFAGEVEAMDASLIFRHESHGAIMVPPESARDLLKPMEFVLYQEATKLILPHVYSRIPADHLDVQETQSHGI